VSTRPLPGASKNAATATASSTKTTNPMDEPRILIKRGLRSEVTSPWAGGHPESRGGRPGQGIGVSRLRQPAGISLRRSHAEHHLCRICWASQQEIRRRPVRLEELFEARVAGLVRSEPAIQTIPSTAVERKRRRGSQTWSHPRDARDQWVSVPWEWAERTWEDGWATNHCCCRPVKHAIQKRACLSQGYAQFRVRFRPHALGRDDTGRALVVALEYGDMMWGRAHWVWFK